ncbi:DUF302 domain-containing protein [Dechloromonas sp.]|uniref:DUF302 domain-containing protein n=1 Tax=Dechloromonas sp. TaxID=1917218 RepID=UPI00286E921A|nr:DUF302 domain-containing protein [Dechloromonas sp.]
MMKLIIGFLIGVGLAVGVIWNSAGSMAFSEQVSPFSVEETTARIQQNIQAAGNGWSISGLRNPAKPVEAEGGNVLPVLLIEACSTKYSGPILQEDSVRFLSLLMPCKIAVYKKNDGKVYIGILNADMIGKLFGSMVGGIMEKVVVDQKKFLVMDPSKPAPALIIPKMGGEGGSGGGAAAGC